MILRWHGHACFEVVDSRGFTIAIDPHDGYSIGLKPPSFRADAILITHEHFDHNAYSAVAKPGAERYSMREGEFLVGGRYRATGVRFYHDKVRGRRRGEVVVYRIEVEGVSLLHLGDLGHVPDDTALAPLKPVDLVLIPVGGTFTIDPREAIEVLKVLDPKVSIPMHYWVRGVNLPLLPVDTFVELARESYEVVKLESNELRLLPEDLQEVHKARVYVLSPP